MVGFPHSEILGSKLVRSSPRLIAAYHVLHRLSAPRHPPNALKALDHSHDRCPRPRSIRSRATLHNQKDHLPPDFSEDMLAEYIRSKARSRPRWPLRLGCSALGYIPSSRFQTSARGSATHELLQDTGQQALQLVEPDGIEPTTSCLQSRRSPN